MRLLLFVLLYSTALFAQTINVPQGKPIMLDGKISEGEWSDAKRLSDGDFAHLYFKQNNNVVLIAIEFLKDKTGTADLYLSSGGEIYDLHASAKLGERKLTANQWPEEWKWWNNDRWVANVSRVDDWGKRTFMDENVREFQIARDRFHGNEWRIFLELMTRAEPKWKTSAYPPDSTNTSDKNWIVLRLE